MTKEMKEIGGRRCWIYDCGSPEALLIQAVDDHDLEGLDSEVAEIERLSGRAAEAEGLSGKAAEAGGGPGGGAGGEPGGGAGFRLVAFKVDDWNADLSPWEAPPVFGSEGFAGGAEATLSYVTDVLIPELCGGHDYQKIYIGGYSLAGFFALWAAYRTDIFSGVAAVSPSVWFPGWTDHAADNSVKAERVYLSLGDKEEKTRNPVMRTVGDNIRRQLELLQADPACADCILEMNQGNHFKEPDLRTAKGFAWLLK